MAESYANNQWYNLQGGVAGPNTGPGIQSLARTPKDNPEFLFPGKVRRNLGGGQDQIIQRGFIRSLLSEVPGVGESIPNRRFFFQFNPERIIRSVAVSSGLMNPLLQDPGQFSVATPGNATFSFDILLNREFEVNNATMGLSDPDVASRVARQSGGSADSMERRANSINSGTGPLQPRDVGKIGVLADLMVMDSIIGQGISDDVINALSKITSISSSWDASDTSSGASVSDFISEEQATSAFSAIRGNSAFLVSTPVRIVFSSMFMIDGFIQGSSVNFTKFNTNMVPTMCAINVTVEAKYIGFAQKDTYLTETLRSASVAPDPIVAPIPDSIKGPEYDVLVSAIKELSSYQIAVGGVDEESHPGSWIGDIEAGGISLGVAKGGYSSYWRIQDYDMFLLRAGFTEGKGTKDKGIGKLFFDANYTLSFSHQPTLRVWRSFVGNESNSASVSGVTATYGPKGDGVAHSQSQSGAGTISVKRDVLLMEVIGQTASANDWDSWQKYYSYGGGGRTEDGAYDNIPHSVYLEAKSKGVSSDTARNLYLQGTFADNAHNSSTPLLIEMELTIVASIQKDGKDSRVAFTTTKRVFRNPGQICFNRFNIPASDVK